MNSYESFGCELNQLDVETLFQRYEQTGFLYPEKRHRLEPFLPVIQENWRRMLAAVSDLIRVVTLDDEANASFGSITDWRSTYVGWCAQHLVSSGKPIGHAGGANRRYQRSNPYVVVQLVPTGEPNAEADVWFHRGGTGGNNMRLLKLSICWK